MHAWAPCCNIKRKVSPISMKHVDEDNKYQSGSVWKNICSAYKMKNPIRVFIQRFQHSKFVTITMKYSFQPFLRISKLIHIATGHHSSLKYKKGIRFEVFGIKMPASKQRHIPKYHVVHICSIHLSIYSHMPKIYNVFPFLT